MMCVESKRGTLCSRCEATCMDKNSRQCPHRQRPTALERQCRPATNVRGGTSCVTTAPPTARDLFISRWGDRVYERSPPQTLPSARSSATVGSTARSRDVTISGAVLEIRTVTRLGRSRPVKARRSETSRSCVQTTRSSLAAYDRMVSSELSSGRRVDTRTVSHPASVKACTVIGEMFMSARRRRERVTGPRVVIVQKLSTQRIALPAERLPPPTPDMRSAPL